MSILIDRRAYGDTYLINKANNAVVGVVWNRCVDGGFPFRTGRGFASRATFKEALAAALSIVGEG